VIIDREKAREERTVEIHVDTQPAAIAVVSAPDKVQPGDALTLALKPALPVALLADAASVRTPGGMGAALKSAMDVKEILVRAPWGEIARAKLNGPLGLYTATLHVPRLAPRGAVDLEIVACDTAGNVSRRPLALEVLPPSKARYASGGAALLLLVGGGLFLRRRARAPRGVA
jgi:hypothetical protein